MLTDLLEVVGAARFLYITLREVYMALCKCQFPIMSLTQRVRSLNLNLRRFIEGTTPASDTGVMSSDIMDSKAIRIREAEPERELGHSIADKHGDCKAHETGLVVAIPAGLASAARACTVSCILGSAGCPSEKARALEMKAADFGEQARVLNELAESIRRCETEEGRNEQDNHP